MDFIDVKYINLISARFQKFKKVKSNLYNFRCPICGDSKKNKNKARGYLYQVKSNTNFKCHNCGINISFNNFLKQIDSVIHKQYTFEKFKEGHSGRNFVSEEPKFEFKKPNFKQSINLPKASENENAKKYLEGRKLNPDKFYYVENFKEWTNSLKYTFDSIKFDEPRIIIPLYYQKRLIGYQGRSIGKSKIKYITIMLEENVPKIYGFDSINKNLPIYVVEGPFDSTFIDNSVALCGSDGDVGCLEGSDLVFVYDNEPRNKEIVRRVGDTIDRGNKVVIWPNGILEKDINDMILSGLDPQSMIKLNTYSGLEAKLKFTTWKKI
jgi:transcription elongation factor Elf1